MSSTISTEAVERVPDSTDLGRVVLVMWQHPETRAIRVIGRLTFDGTQYQFAYTQGALSVADFRPLPGLRKLRQRYSSATLFPFFAQRVMSAKRPDFPTYLSQLELQAEDATPWEQLIRSGGWREGDTLQFMEMPSVRNGRVETTFLTNGIRHVPMSPMTVSGRPVVVSAEAHAKALARLRNDDPLVLLPENHNPKSRFAMLVADVNHNPLGYVPDVLARGMRQLAASGTLSATVAHINNADTPAHLRLVVCVEAQAPSTFTFDADKQWTTLA